MSGKHYYAPSILQPENMLREARRQKGLSYRPVPRVCVLDPDGDLVRHAKAVAGSRIDPYWACFHTEMVALDGLKGGGEAIGCVGCAVGAPFAVMVAEQLFACGCEFLISISSAGQLSPRCPPPCFLLIDRALRDEGTSHHYAEAEDYSKLDPQLSRQLDGILSGLPFPVIRGASWTTDAPFRETAAAVAEMQARGLDAVEMEAAALYAFAQARKRPVVCLSQITNALGQTPGEFEKGVDQGAGAALALIAAIATDYFSRTQSPGS